jgi:hypothetical protein
MGERPRCTQHYRRAVLDDRLGPAPLSRMDSRDPERAFQAAIVSSVRVYNGHSIRLPSDAVEIDWRGTAPERDADVHRYGILQTLLEAGIDATGIRTYREPEAWGTYWVVDLTGARRVTLTDDTEPYVIWLEGPWPFAATFSDPDGARTEVNHSLDDLTARVLAWCTEA